MLQFGGVVALRMDVADFLQLECPFERNREEITAPDKEGIFMVGILLRHGFDRLVFPQHLFHQVGKPFDPAGQFLAFVPGQSAGARNLQRHHQHHGHLAGEGLGGGHPDFGAGMQIDAAAGFAGNGRSNHVAESRHNGALVLGFAHRSQGIGRLARLADGDDEILRSDDRVAVAEFGGLLHLGGNAGHFLEGIFPHHAGMHRGAAAYHQHTANLRGIARRKIEPGEDGRAHIEIQPPPDGITDGNGLLEYFLKHEVGIVPLFSRVLVPLHRGHFATDRGMLQVEHLHPVGGDNGHVEILEIDRVARMRNNGRGIAGNHRLVLAQANHDRASATRGHQLARLVVGHHHDAIGSLDLLERLADSRLKVILVAIGNQLDEHLGIGIRNTRDALLRQPRLDLLVVFDDSVVHHYEMAGGIEMRMRIDLVRQAVRRPAGMANALGGLMKYIQFRCIDLFAQRLDFTGVLHHPDLSIIQTGHAGRIIAPILHPAQAIHQNFRSIPFSKVAYDSTHSMNS